MISADGENQTPSMLFTYNPKFNFKTSKTSYAKLHNLHLKLALKKYKIDKKRIVFMKGNGKKYVGESYSIIKHFLSFYQKIGKVSASDLIFHDGGSSYKKQKVSVFDELGFQNHETYPVDVHQYLSPNDNNLHGCKSKWTEEYYKMKDSISPPLRLMQLLDLDTIKNSKKYFKNNILKVTKTCVCKIIRG